jgi:hypothetical protein
VAISLYADCVVAAGAVSCAGCAVAAVKGFADACRRGEEGVAEGVVCREDGEGERRREELIASPVRVKLRRLRRDTVIISLSSTRVSASSFFVQTCCSSS